VNPVRGVGSVAALALAVSLLMARVHPFGDAGLYSTNATQLIMDGTSIPIPPNVRDILINKCEDCHSVQTRTPFYGRLAPMSWLMERDIVEARKAMNLSQWDSYTPEQQGTFKSKIAQKTKSYEMPLLQYRMIHRNARLTDVDIQALTQWAHGTSTIGADTYAANTLAGDPARGKDVFEKRCTGCHALETNREGPHLQGVYGRTTGAAAAFPYSDTLVKAHVVWDDKSLDRWLADPDAFLPGNNMDFLVPKPQERSDVISYLKQASGK
jgi:cytochrome c